MFFVSLIFTTVAMALGSYISPQSQSNLTVRLLLSNFLCDAFTIILTIWLFRTLRCAESWNRIPIAVLLSVILAGACAFGSLYLGLVGSDREMSALQVLMVIIGRDPTNSSSYFFDGFFCVMHTTFIPLGVYMVICMSLWWAKLTLLLGRFLLIPKDRTQRPYGLARASFMMLAAVCALLRLMTALRQG